MRTHTEVERLVARQTLEEVMRKLEEALRLSRELDCAKGEASCEHKGVHG